MATAQRGVIFRLSGLDKIQGAVAALERSYRLRVAEALTEEAEKVLKDAQDNYVPIDEGDLVASGKVSKPDITANNITVDISFGTTPDTAARAVAIHEHPSPSSPPSWRNVRNEKGQFRKVRFSPEGTGPKYLEKPLRAASGVILGHVGSKVRL